MSYRFDHLMTTVLRFYNKRTNYLYLAKMLEVEGIAKLGIQLDDLNSHLLTKYRKLRHDQRIVVCRNFMTRYCETEKLSK